jgi:cobalt-zinc-cadmium efflux system membrane fusion protein
MRTPRRTGASALFVLWALTVACGEGAQQEVAAGGSVGPAEEGHEMVVVLDSAAMRIAEVEVGRAERVLTSEFSVTGRVTFDEDRVSHLGPRTEGYVEEIPGQLGAEVVPGELLAVLESPEVGALRAELNEARLIRDIATENFEREQRLEAQGISSRRALLEAESTLRRAEAAVQRASQRLVALGASEGEGAEFTIRAPYAGVIVEKHATRGEIVAPTDRLFTVADLSNLWIELDIYERDLPKVREGQQVTVTTSAYPADVFRGSIVYLADILDAERRTVHARVEVENRDGLLRPGMFATASVAVPEGTPVVAVPREAIQTVEGADIVWVPGDEDGEFVGRPILAGQELPGDRVEILSGLEADEPVVVRGAFTLKSEHEEGEFGGHAH